MLQVFSFLAFDSICAVLLTLQMLTNYARVVVINWPSVELFNQRPVDFKASGHGRGSQVLKNTSLILMLVAILLSVNWSSIL